MDIGFSLIGLMIGYCFGFYFIVCMVTSIEKVMKDRGDK